VPQFGTIATGAARLSDGPVRESVARARSGTPDRLRRDSRFPASETRQAHFGLSISPEPSQNSADRSGLLRQAERSSTGAAKPTRQGFFARMAVRSRTVLRLQRSWWLPCVASTSSPTQQRRSAIGNRLQRLLQQSSAPRRCFAGISRNRSVRQLDCYYRWPMVMGCSGGASLSGAIALAVSGLQVQNRPAFGLPCGNQDDTDRLYPCNALRRLSRVGVQRYPGGCGNRPHQSHSATAVRFQRKAAAVRSYSRSASTGVIDSRWSRRTIPEMTAPA
jgi:hypothetical protein